MAPNEGSTLRILLILSAIDLLSSALTAGLVLFVILVGGDVGNVQALASPKGGNGLNEVVAVDASGQVELLGLAPSNVTQTPSDLHEKAFFNSETTKRRFHLVPSGKSNLSVRSTTPFELIVRPVIGPVRRLFFRCAPSDRPLDISIDPLSFPDCVGPPQGATVQFPHVATLLVSSQNRSLTFPEKKSSSLSVRAFDVSGALPIPADLAVWGVEE